MEPCDGECQILELEAGYNGKKLRDRYMIACQRYGVSVHAGVEIALTKLELSSRSSSNSSGPRVLDLTSGPPMSEADARALTEALAVPSNADCQEFDVVDIAHSGSGGLKGPELLQLIRAAGPRLRFVDLSVNAVGRDVLRDLFRGGMACETLDLSSSRVRKLDLTGRFMQLHTLRLDYNGTVTSLPDGSFQSMPSLRRLSLCGTAIANLWTTAAALRHLPSLAELRFQKCTCCDTTSPCPALAVAGHKLVFLDAGGCTDTDMLHVALLSRTVPTGGDASLAATSLETLQTMMMRGGGSATLLGSIVAPQAIPASAAPPAAADGSVPSLNVGVPPSSAQGPGVQWLRPVPVRRLWGQREDGGSTTTTDEYDSQGTGLTDSTTMRMEEDDSDGMLSDDVPVRPGGTLPSHGSGLSDASSSGDSDVDNRHSVPAVLPPPLRRGRSLPSPMVMEEAGRTLSLATPSAAAHTAAPAATATTARRSMAEPAAPGQSSGPSSRGHDHHHGMATRSTRAALALETGDIAVNARPMSSSIASRLRPTAAGRRSLAGAAATAAERASGAVGEEPVRRPLRGEGGGMAVHGHHHQRSLSAAMASNASVGSQEVQDVVMAGGDDDDGAVEVEVQRVRGGGPEAQEGRGRSGVGSRRGRVCEERGNASGGGAVGQQPESHSGGSCTGAVGREEEGVRADPDDMQTDCVMGADLDMGMEEGSDVDTRLRLGGSGGSGGSGLGRGGFTCPEERLQAEERGGALTSGSHLAAVPSVGADEQRWSSGGLEPQAGRGLSLGLELPGGVLGRPSGMDAMMAEQEPTATFQMFGSGAGGGSGGLISPVHAAPVLVRILGAEDREMHRRQQEGGVDSTRGVGAPAGLPSTPGGGSRNLALQFRQVSTLCKEKYYREFMLVSLPRLETLDNVRILPEERERAAVVFRNNFEPFPNNRQVPGNVLRALQSRETGGVRAPRSLKRSAACSFGSLPTAEGPVPDTRPPTREAVGMQPRREPPVAFQRSVAAAKMASCIWPATRPICTIKPPYLDYHRKYRPRQFEYHPTQANYMVFGTLHGEVVVVDHEKNEVVGQVQSIGAPHSILGLCWLNKDPSKLVAGSDNGSIQLYDVNQMKAAMLLAGAKDQNKRLGNGGGLKMDAGGLTSAVAPSAPYRGNYSYASTGRSPAIYTYDDFEQLTSVHINCTDDYFLASGYSNHVGLYDLRTGKRLQIFPDLHREHINVLKFAHHSPYLFATSSFDKDIKMWDVRQRADKPLYTCQSDRGNVMVCFSNDDSFLLSSAVDNEVRQHLAVDGQLHLKFDLPSTNSGHNYTRSYYMNGRDYIITGSCEENVVRLLCARTGRRLRDVALEGRGLKNSLYVQSLRGDPFRDFHFCVLVAYNHPNSRSEIVKVNLMSSNGPKKGNEMDEQGVPFSVLGG